jgi:hypothetical protein
MSASDPGDMAVNASAMIDLARVGMAWPVLLDLFAEHGRESFAIGPLTERPRWWSEATEAVIVSAIAHLCATGHVRLLPDGRYRIVSREIMMGDELKYQANERRSLAVG